MVSFSCPHCQDTVKKPKVLAHAQHCGNHYFTCIDCMQNFTLDEIKHHTSCVTEVEKYQGKWKGPSAQSSSNSNNHNNNGKTNNSFLQRPPKMSLKDLETTSSDDDEKPETTGKKKSAAPAPPAAMAGSSSSSSTSQLAHHKRSREDGQGEKEGKQAHSSSRATSSTSEGGKKSHTKLKDSPLLLPRATLHSEDDAEAETPNKKKKQKGDHSVCVIASFELGPTEEVLDMVKDIIHTEGEAHKTDAGTKEVTLKQLTAHLTSRYEKRIQKNIRKSLGLYLQEHASEVLAIRHDEGMVLLRDKGTKAAATAAAAKKKE